MISAFGPLMTYLRGPARRMAALVAQGRTIEVAALADADDVIEIALGFGIEYWKVDPGYSIKPNDARIENGRLIVEHANRVESRERLAFLAKPIERVRWRT